MKLTHLALCAAASLLLGGCMSSLELAVRSCNNENMNIKARSQQCFRAGQIYHVEEPVDAQGNRIANDLALAAAYYLKGCKMDNAKACNNLASLLDEGVPGPNGFEPNPRLAFDYFEKTCEMDDGHPVGCASVGEMYMEGKGVQRDYAKARPYLEVGCEYEVAEACRLLGRLYRDGLGVSRSDATARTYDEWACYFGDDEACQQ